MIFGDASDKDLRPEVKKFFTIKYSWAWINTKTTSNQWQWIDFYPQDYGWNTDKNIPDQIPVATASHPTLNIGKSFHYSTRQGNEYHTKTIFNLNGKIMEILGKQPKYNSKTRLTPYTNEGLYLAMQWKQAFKVNPKVVMVTQFNEWIMGIHFRNKNSIDSMFLGKKLKIGGWYFVDDFNREYNRDIEPMKGGYTDDYYYQLVNYVRKFKGMKKPETPSPPKTILIDGKFSEWKDVKPIYRDFRNDQVNRDWKGYDTTAGYINKTGRNDFIESRVTYDKKYIYFYVKTSADITPYTNKNWMLLFIDSDRNKATGWEGYDYVINKKVIDKRTTTIYKYINLRWKEIARLKYFYSGNKMEIKVPIQLLKINASKPTFEFKWADNIWGNEVQWGKNEDGSIKKVVLKWGNITGFFVNGDCAPDRRFNYLYQVK